MLVLAGRLDPEQNVIKLDPRLTPEQAVDTLIHELLHFVWKERLDSPTRKSRRRAEEPAIERLAGGLTQIMHDNPALVDWIWECLHGTS